MRHCGASRQVHDHRLHRCGSACGRPPMGGAALVRILQVVSDNNRRGAQVFAGDLGMALVARGHGLHTVALEPGSAMVARSGAHLDNPVLAPSWPRPSGLRRLRTAMKPADVVIAHGSSTLPACALAGLGVGVPFVYRQISDPEVWTSTHLRRARTRAFLGRAARVVALSEGNRAQLCRHLGVEPTVIRVIPTGVPAAAFPATAPEGRPAARERLGLPERPTALFVGSLSWEKGPEVAVEAIGQVVGMTLVLVGDGPNREALKALADQVAPSRVVFRPPVDTIHDYLAASDVLLLTSRTEAVPAVVIEAGMAAVPVVAARVGAVPELLQDGEAGVLVESGGVNGFAVGAAAFVEDRNRADDLGRRAHDWCLERFDIAPVAAAWEVALEELVAQGSSSGGR